MDYVVSFYKTLCNHPSPVYILLERSSSEVLVRDNFIWQQWESQVVVLEEGLELYQLLNSYSMYIT